MSDGVKTLGADDDFSGGVETELSKLVFPEQDSHPRNNPERKLTRVTTDTKGPEKPVAPTVDTSQV